MGLVPVAGSLFRTAPGEDECVLCAIVRLGPVATAQKHTNIANCSMH